MAASGPLDIDTLWDFDRPAESEALFRAVLAQAEPGSLHYGLITKIRVGQRLSLIRSQSVTIR